MENGVALVLLVGQDAPNRADRPLAFPTGRRYALIRQEVRDIANRLPGQEHLVDRAHNGRLFLYDFRSAVFPLAIAQKALVGDIDLAVLHALLLSPAHVFADRTAFLLGEAAHDCQHDLAFGVQGMEVLFLEDDLHPHRLQLAHRLESVHRIPGKAGDGLGENEINLAVHGALNHLIKPVALLCVRPGNALVGKDLDELPGWVGLNIAGVEADLRLIAGLLFVLLGGDAGISRHAELIRRHEYLLSDPCSYRLNYCNLLFSAHLFSFRARARDLSRAACLISGVQLSLRDRCFHGTSTISPLDK